MTNEEHSTYLGQSMRCILPHVLTSFAYSAAAVEETISGYKQLCSILLGR